MRSSHHLELHQVGTRDMLAVAARGVSVGTYELHIGVGGSVYDTYGRSVLLSRAQVEQLHDMLGRWLAEGWDGVPPVQGPTSVDIIEHYRDIAVRERVRADHERIDGGRRLAAALSLIPAFDEYRTSTDMAGRLRLWCAAHGYPVGDGAVIEHDECLAEPVTIVLATTTGMPWQSLAPVSINGASPDVYVDRTADEGSWQDATAVAIGCARSHTWAWDGGRYLRTARGVEAHISRLFGLDGSVISRCRDCAAFDDGTTDAACPCPGFTVYCPACGNRCQFTLPEIPTLEEN